MKLKEMASLPVILNLLKKVLKLYGIFAAANLCVKIYQFVYHTTRARKLWKHVPGDRLDKIGFRIAANAEKFHDYYAEQGLRHPTAPLVKGAGPGAEMICNTAESIEWLLKDEFPNVTKLDGGEDYLFHLMREFIGGDGIFVLRHGELLQDENDKWFKERKVASRIFTKANFESFMYDTFVAKSKLAINKLNTFAEKGEMIDMQELFFSFTMDSIEKFFFGTDVDTITGSMSEYAKSFDKAHVNMMNVLITTIPIQLANRLLFPYPFGKWGNNSDESQTLSLRLFGMLSKSRKEFDSAVKHLDSHVYKYIEQTRKDPNLSSRNDIIANFLNSKIGNELSDKMLRDIILNLTIAGRDTTACTLSWLFFELSQNLDVQRKLAEEIKENLKGRMPTLDDFEPSKLPYLNGVLYEALRLHPPVPTNVKTPTKDIQYRDGTIIPRGTKLMYLPYAMGRNPVTYPDPLRFLPERWIPFKQPTLYEFPVFQAGPRFCLGKDMAMFEAKLLTVALIQNFEFRLLDGEADKIWYSNMLTMSIVNGKDRLTNNLWMIPKKR